MKRMAEIFRGRIIDVTEKSYTIELTGDCPSSMRSWWRSTARRSWRRFAPAPAASVVANASSGYDEPPSSLSLATPRGPPVYVRQSRFRGVKLDQLKSNDGENP
jgi:hypothetical protein